MEILIMYENNIAKGKSDVSRRQTRVNTELIKS